MNQKERANALSKEIIGATIAVHSVLGPSLLESAYLVSLSHELGIRNISHKTQVALPLEYKGIKLDAGYRIDILVEGLVIVEIKSIEALNNVHKAQPLTYLRLTNLWLGLLLNFNVVSLRQGIQKVVLGY